MSASTNVLWQASGTIVALVCTATALAWSNEWTGFQNGGHLRFDATPVPRLRWSAADGIAWRLQLAGYGQSSPLATSQRVYVTSTSGGNKERLHIQGFDLATGAERWRFDAANRSPEESSNYVSRAAPSPVCDAGGVYALFEGGNLFALDHDGRLRWQRDLVSDYGPIQARHGLASSLKQ